MHPEQFEIDLLSFLENIHSVEQPIDSMQGRRMSWLALLFAVLACGAQFSNDSGKDRDLRSKVFGTPPIQCLVEEFNLTTTQCAPHFSAFVPQIFSTLPTRIRFKLSFLLETAFETTRILTQLGFSWVSRWLLPCILFKAA